ncbi:hypothetical protein [Cellulomonas sp. Y8]|uniref:hypothetical protein n=1 Tax=Cellulomonas sp. Y8 TaxID=2591145 RepID=UPI003D74DB5B
MSVEPDEQSEPEAETPEPWSCPIPQSHDRFGEAHYFLHRLESDYHHPQLFRYNLNAFVSALRAVHEILAKELERKGEVTWWKERRREFAEDEVLARFARGRNLALHQRSILEGSRVSIGLFRGRRMKLAQETDIQTDEPSDALLRRVLPHFIPFLVDEEHSAIGEQIGVERLYFVRELSPTEDVLRACFRALARTTGALSEAHNRLGAEHEQVSDEDVLDPRHLAEVSVLLESDLDPEAIDRWGW